MKKLFLFFFLFSSLAFSQKFQLDWNDNLEIIKAKMETVGATQTSLEYAFRGGQYYDIPIKLWIFTFLNDSLLTVSMELQIDESVDKKLYYEDLSGNLARKNNLGIPDIINDDSYWWEFSKTTSFSVRITKDNEIKFMYVRNRFSLDN